MRVLREIKNVKQETGRGRRRWFESDALELVLWLADNGSVTGFQLCYDLGRGERALTWREGEGFEHSIVDTGDASPLKNETPVLRPDPQVPWAEIVGLFDKGSGTLEGGVRQMIRDKLDNRTKADAAK